MRTKARSRSAADGAGGASTGGSSRAWRPGSGNRTTTACRPSRRGPTCEYPAGPRPAPREDGAWRGAGRRAHGRLAICPVPSKPTPHGSPMRGGSGVRRTWGGVSHPWCCSVEGLRGSPKAWPGCPSRLERTEQPRGLTQRTPGTLSSKQTPALLQPRTGVPLPVVRGPRGPGADPGRSKKGKVCLDPGASSNPASSRRPAWSHPGSLSPLRRSRPSGVGRREGAACDTECGVKVCPVTSFPDGPVTVWG